MASWEIKNKKSLTASVSTENKKLTGTISSGGTADHNRLTNRAKEDQHPIEAISGLQDVLDSKIDSEKALFLVNEANKSISDTATAVKGKAKGLYFDAAKELNSRKAFWYLTSEIDSLTGMGTKESIISGPYDLGMGGGSGGSGGGGVTTVTVKQVDWPAAAAVGNSETPTKIQISWSSVIGEDKTPTGKGTVYLSINNKQVEVRPKQDQGIVEFDISRYIISGDNKIEIKVLDTYGTTGITVGIINGISLKLTSNFNSETAFYDMVEYTYTPIGNVTKTVYFIVDGELYGTQTVKSSNELQTCNIRNLTHRAHTLQVYFAADIGGQTITSNSLFYDITFVENGNPTPIIASDFNSFTQEQYVSFNIPYRVFISNKNLATVLLKVNGEVVRESEVTTVGTHIWSYRSDTPGTYTLEISCGEISKSFQVDVVESNITITPTPENLELALSAQSRSNEESLEKRETWTYTDNSGLEPITYNCKFTNFNWSSDGWILDKDGINVLSVGGDARVEIPINIFNKNFTSRGKTIELEIATRSIRDYDTTIISCLDEQKSSFYEVEEALVEEETRKKG